MKHFYHKGIENRKFDSEKDVIPDGFIPGKYVDPEVDKIRKEKLSQKAKEQWANPEQRQKLIDSHNTKDYKEKMHAIVTNRPKRHVYNNGIKEIRVIEGELPPDGFVPGRLPVSEETLQKMRNAASNRKGNKGTTLGKIAIHKNNQEKYILPEELDLYIDQGWIKGGKPKRELRDYSHVWNKGLTKDTDPRMKIISNKVREYNLNMPQETRDKISKSVSRLWEDPEYRHNSIEKFKGHIPWNKGLTGVYTQTEESNNLRVETFRKTAIEKYGSMDEFYKYRSEQNKILCAGRRDEINQKRKETLIKKYGSMENYYAVINAKSIETHKKNNSFNTSKYELYYYELLKQQFGENNVIRQYRDKDRYPFLCDFYIPSEDLFIEINYHWTHGKMPFDETNTEHLDILEILYERSKKSDFYERAIYVWTDLDVRKLNYAIKNKLHYWRYYADGQVYIIN